jgi:hypothetical protein
LDRSIRLCQHWSLEGVGAFGHVVVYPWHATMPHRPARLFGCGMQSVNDPPNRNLSRLQRLRPFN